MIRLLAITLLLIALPCYAQWQYNSDGTQQNWNTMPNGTMWKPSSNTPAGIDYIQPQRDYTQSYEYHPQQPQQITPRQMQTPSFNKRY